MRCIYCQNDIRKIRMKSLFLKYDPLCTDCRKKMKLNRRYIDIDGLKVETFYEYDSLFRSLLLQYKECYDEALKDVFLHEISEYICFRYHGYEIVLIPSSAKKYEERGFNHLELIFESVGLKINHGLKMREELIQEGKNFNERQLMKNNYYYEGEAIRKALIVDDVLTTGASIIGAYRCLDKKVRKIGILTIAN